MAQKLAKHLTSISSACKWHLPSSRTTTSTTPLLKSTQPKIWCLCRLEKMRLLSRMVLKMSRQNAYTFFIAFPIGFAISSPFLGWKLPFAGQLASSAALRSSSMATCSTSCSRWCWGFQQVHITTPQWDEKSLNHLKKNTSSVTVNTTLDSSRFKHSPSTVLHCISTKLGQRNTTQLLHTLCMIFPTFHPISGGDRQRSSSPKIRSDGHGSVGLDGAGGSVTATGAAATGGTGTTGRSGRTGPGRCGPFLDANNHLPFDRAYLLGFRQSKKTTSNSMTLCSTSGDKRLVISIFGFNKSLVFFGFTVTHHPPDHAFLFLLLHHWARRNLRFRPGKSREVHGKILAQLMPMVMPSPMVFGLGWKWVLGPKPSG